MLKSLATLLKGPHEEALRQQRGRGTLFGPALQMCPPTPDI